MKEKLNFFEFDYPILAKAVTGIFIYLTFKFMGYLSGFGFFALIFITNPYITRQAKKIRVNHAYPLLMVVFLALPGFIIWYLYYIHQKKN